MSRKRACAAIHGPACVDDPTGGACPPFTCRELGLGFGAWLGWRPAANDTHATDDPRGEIVRFNPAAKNHDGWAWEHRNFAAVVRTRCRSRVTRSARENLRAFRRAALHRLCAPRTIGGSSLAHVVLRIDPILTI